MREEDQRQGQGGDAQIREIQYSEYWDRIFGMSNRKVGQVCALIPVGTTGPSRDEMAAMVMREGVKERVRQLAQEVGGLEVLAAKAGVSKSTVYRLAQEGSGNIDTIWKIGRACSTSVDWIFYGRMPPGQPDAQPSEDGYTLVARYDVRASAGGGALVEQENMIEKIAFRTEWINRRLRRAASSLACIEADGDSMVPTIGDGDLLLIDTSEKSTRRDGVYVLLTPLGLIVKRVQLRRDGGVELRADNPAYKTELVPAKATRELTVIGRVVWRGGGI